MADIRKGTERRTQYVTVKLSLAEQQQLLTLATAHFRRPGDELRAALGAAWKAFEEQQQGRD